MKLTDILTELVRARDALSLTWPKMQDREAYRRHLAALGGLDALIDDATGITNQRLKQRLEDRKLQAKQQADRKVQKVMERAERRRHDVND